MRVQPPGEPREETVSQGGGVIALLSGGDERSDPRLTTGPYTDTTRLETADLIEKLPDFLGETMADTQLGTQTTGASSPDVAHAVMVNGGNGSSESIENTGESHDLTLAVAACRATHSNSASGVRIPLSPPRMA